MTTQPSASAHHRASAAGSAASTTSASSLLAMATSFPEATTGNKAALGCQPNTWTLIPSRVASFSLASALTTGASSALASTR